MSLATRLSSFFRPANVKESGVPLIASSSAGRAVWTDWDSEKAIRDGLKANTWVYVANRFIASKISPIPWYVEELHGEVWERISQHPAERLLSEPNEVMSGQDLRERWFYNLGLAGNAVTHMVIARKLPVELWPLMPSAVKPVPTANGPISAYEYQVSGSSKRRIEPAEIIHLQYVDPSNIYWGMSPLQAAGNIVDTDVEAVRWNKTSLQNRAKKDYAFFPDEPISDEQWEEAREQIRSQHQGGENAGGFFLGSMPGKLTEMGMTARELDYINSRGMNKEEILAAYGIAEILVTGKGIVKNYEVAVRQFWEDLAIPTLDDLSSELNHSIMPWFDPGWRRNATVPPKLRLTYDTSHIAVLQEGFGEKLDHALKLLELGYPINVINQKLGLGLDDLEGGDELPSRGQPGEPETVARGRGPGGRKDDTDWTIEWKRVDSQRTEWEKRIEREIGSLFDDEGKLVSEAFRQDGEAGALKALDGMSESWEASLAVVYREVVSHFGEEEASRLTALAGQSNHGKPGEVKVTFDPLAQFVGSWIRTVAAKKITEISSTTRDAIGRVIGSGLEDNKTTDQIARDIRSTYSDWAEPSDPSIRLGRSYRIARTEVGTAANWSQMEAARQVQDETGLTIQKRWVSSRDSRVRDSHEGIDGETRPLNERFSNGLNHPGDPDGPASEVIQCRCVASNVVIRRR